MYAAKAGGRGQIVAFRPDLLETASARSELAALLRGAASRDELQLAFQPVVQLDDGVAGRRGGARSLAAAGPPAPPAGGVPRAGRGDRRDPADRSLGHRRGLPPGARVAGPPRPAGPAAVRRTCRPASSATPGLVPIIEAALAETGLDAGEPHPRDHRGHAADARLRDRPADRRAARARAAPRDRRLRDRLLVARLPARLPDRRAQDRPLIRARRARAPATRTSSARRSSSSAARCAWT